MKSLDEVIKGMKYCNQDSPVDCTKCAYEGTDCQISEMLTDALHYLKQYRSDQIEWEGTRKAWAELGQAKFAEYDKAKQKYIEKLKELDIGTLNEPLTWDELREMEGKPVWVENHERKEWMVIDSVTNTCVDCANRRNRTLLLRKCPDGTERTWQAYRKERKER